ncbi:hypothetical protein [uncultured Algibacter sp.]|uniref:hypothetical protein n=1 Tax=uncultured Algibacter sp. TaxID=298659 RepID=UPI0032173E29
MSLPPYGAITVLHKKGFQGHVGYVVNFEEINGEKYAYLLGGNQNNKVCVQQFKVYMSGGKVIYKTQKGSKYTLKGYIYPKEYKLGTNKNYSNDYRKSGYIVEAAISTR